MHSSLTVRHNTVCLCWQVLRHVCDVCYHTLLMLLCYQAVPAATTSGSHSADDNPATARQLSHKAASGETACATSLALDTCDPLVQVTMCRIQNYTIPNQIFNWVGTNDIPGDPCWISGFLLTMYCQAKYRAYRMCNIRYQYFRRKLCTVVLALQRFITKRLPVDYCLSVVVS